MCIFVVLIFTAVKKLKPCGSNLNFIRLLSRLNQTCEHDGVRCSKSYHHITFSLFIRLFKVQGNGGPLSQLRTLAPCTTKNHVQNKFAQGD